MFLQEPGHSPYDLRFQCLGFPVRISWTFWITCVVFGYGLTQRLDLDFGVSSPGAPLLLLLWAVCLFVSILIHELGHALAFRQNGIESSIVLYYLGGLAIPTSDFAGGRGFQSVSPKQSMWISAAGPLAQIIPALVLIFGLRLAGYSLVLSGFSWVPWPLNRIDWLHEGGPIDSAGLLAIAVMYANPSVWWAILNLIPVWPLDGGRIMSSFLQTQGGNIVQALWVSVVTAALVAFYGFSNGERYLAIMFLILAINNYQAIQQVSGPRY